MLEQGEQFPHAQITTVEGRVFSYSSIWQRKNLVLVVLPPGESGDESEYAARLAGAAHEFSDLNSECIVTREPGGGLKPPAFLVVDKWGEILHVATAPAVEHMPSPRALLDWVEYVEHKCPECEGETK